MRHYRPGDFVACYLTNTEVYEQLLTWGMVIDVSETLKDILVLDPHGNVQWWPSKRWRPYSEAKKEMANIVGSLA